MSPSCVASKRRRATLLADGSLLRSIAREDSVMHTVASSSRPQHGVHTLARLGRGSNEDTFISAPITVEGAGGPVHVLAVFDGHSSASVSNMAAAELPQLMTQLISSALSSSAAAADVDAAMPQILQTAFEQLDKRVQPLDNSGSTATVAVLTPKQLHLAWVGDSRGVLLGQGGRVLAFTQEHRATREDEQERIAAAGGAVLNNSGLRVMGILQCTRAIGDKDLQSYGVIPTPDVLSLPRTGNEEFLVLATDGLWDVMSNEEVYDYALKAVKRVEERQARQPSSNGTCAGCHAAGIAARALSNYARKQRGSRDDITVMLVNLGQPCSCTDPPAVLSSATASNGVLTTSSTGAGRPSEGSVAAGVQLHSSPAVLGGQQAGASDQGLSGHRQQPQQQQEAPFLPPRQQHPQHSLPAAPRPPQVPQQQQHKWRPGATLGNGLFLQPSVCPGPASAMHAAAFDAGPQRGDGMHSSLLSDLALSSPFAMMLGGAIAEVEVEVEVDVVEVVDGFTSSSSGVVSGGSAPPALNLVAALGHSGSIGLRKRSLSVALGNSRSCGSVGAPPLGPMGPMRSTEPPVVVLT